MSDLKLHSGLFSFLSKRGCSIHDMRHFLTIYALEVHNISRPRKNREEWYVIISELTQDDFDTFKKCYNKHKVFKKKKNFPKDSYSEWYDRCNLDGSFAYNGVADDF